MVENYGVEYLFMVGEYSFMMENDGGENLFMVKEYPFVENGK